jgi:hypothetical protein
LRTLQSSLDAARRVWFFQMRRAAAVLHPFVLDGTPFGWSNQRETSPSSPEYAMNRRFAGSLVVFALCATSLLAADAKPEQVAKAKADEVAQATVKGDCGKLADLTYPTVVKMMGGRDKMIVAVETGLKNMKDKGYEFVSAKVGEASPLVRGGPEVFTVVPFILEMKVPEGKVRINSYLLGISKNKGKTWTFVDAGKIADDPKLTKKLLPNLPATLKLPKKEKPVFQKDE